MGTETPCGARSEATRAALQQCYLRVCEAARAAAALARGAPKATGGLRESGNAPCTPRSAFSTAELQAPQVMPPTASCARRRKQRRRRRRVSARCPKRIGSEHSAFRLKQPQPRTQRARNVPPPQRRDVNSARAQAAREGRALSVRRRATANKATPRGANASAAASSASSIASSGSRSTDASAAPRAAGGAPMAKTRCAIEAKLCESSHACAARRCRDTFAEPHSQQRAWLPWAPRPRPAAARARRWSASRCLRCWRRSSRRRRRSRRAAPLLQPLRGDARSRRAPPARRDEAAALHGPHAACGRAASSAWAAFKRKAKGSDPILVGSAR